MSSTIVSAKNGRCWLPAALGRTDLLGRPASNMGMPGRLSADPKSRKRDLRSKSKCKKREWC